MEVAILGLTPNTHSHANLALLLHLERIQMIIPRIVRLSSLSRRTRSQLLNMMTSLYVDSLALKLLHGITRQLLIKHGQHLLRNIIYSDVVVLDELWVQPPHILRNQIVQLSTKLDTRGSSSHYSKVEQLLFHLHRSGRESRAFKARQNAIPDPACVTHVFEEKCVFFDAGRAKRLAVTSNRNNQLVVIDVKQLAHLHLPLLLFTPLLGRLARMPVRSQRNTLPWIIDRFFHSNRLILEIYVVGPALDEFDLCAPASHRLERGSEFERADCG